MKNEKKYISKKEALIKLQKYCAYQDRCHQEVKRKLLDLGIYGEDLDEIMYELIIEKFLNEERFARSFARGKFNYNKWGRIKIKQALKSRQISEYCLKKAISEINDEDYLHTLQNLIDKKNTLIKKTIPIFQRRIKLANYLISKGYESYMVWAEVKKIE